MLRRVILPGVGCVRSSYLTAPAVSSTSEVHVIGDETARARWLLQRLGDALTARREGIPVVAFGAWAAFGMVDWSSLMCHARNDAEDGVYTFAGPRGVPRPTLVAEVLSELCAGASRLPELVEVGARTSAVVAPA